MDVMFPRCAGLDVHKDTVVACARCVSPPTHQEVRSFSTTTSGLFDLADWLETAAYYMLRDGIDYHYLGPHHFDRREKTRTINRLVRRLHDLGCEVELKHARACVDAGERAEISQNIPRQLAALPSIIPLCAALMTMRSGRR